MAGCGGIYLAANNSPHRAITVHLRFAFRGYSATGFPTFLGSVAFVTLLNQGAGHLRQDHNKEYPTELDTRLCNKHKKSQQRKAAGFVLIGPC